MSIYTGYWVGIKCKCGEIKWIELWDYKGNARNHKKTLIKNSIKKEEIIIKKVIKKPCKYCGRYFDISTSVNNNVGNKICPSCQRDNLNY